jgi:hypothetical protein
MSVRRFAIPAAEMPAGPAAPPRPRPGEHFLKGPIPRDWILRAMPLPGRALHVAMEVWYRAGLTRRAEVVLSLEQVAKAGGFDRATASRALKVLERVGLVAVSRGVGQAPRVTLLEAPRDTPVDPGRDRHADSGVAVGIRFCVPPPSPLASARRIIHRRAMSEDDALMKEHTAACHKAAISRYLVDQFRDEVGPKWLEIRTDKKQAAEEVRYAMQYFEAQERRHLREFHQLRKRIGLEPLPRGWRVPIRVVPIDPAHP